MYRQRVHVTQRESTYTFTTASLPDKAGIDPFALLIDRIPDDNLKSVTLVNDKASPKTLAQQHAALRMPR